MRRPAVLRRHDDDREILRLALPAFGALVAEPLYVLADTAIVGHLGTRPLGGLAVAGTVLTSAFGIFNFLAYSTTAAVARRIGAGDERAAAEHGVDGIWLALGLGAGADGRRARAGAVIVDVMGASARMRAVRADRTCASVCSARRSMLIALAGTGYLRGLPGHPHTARDRGSPRTCSTSRSRSCSCTASTSGIAGSAWGTVIAQVAAAAAYLVIVGGNVRHAARVGAA